MADPIQKENYSIIEPIGQGRNGTVYRGWNADQRRWCAVKLISPQATQDPLYVRQIMARTKAIGQHDLSCIATIIEIKKIDNQYLIASELISGKTLDELIFDSQLDIDHFIDLANKIVKAVAAAHEAIEIHGNLRPTNIMLTESGEIKLMDFGLNICPSQLIDETNPEALRYLSPEQVDGQSPNFLSDLYSLGTIFYQLLTRQPLYIENDMGELFKAVRLCEFDVTSLTKRSIPSEIILVVKKLLSKKPADRFLNAEELANTMEAIGTHLKEYELIKAPRQTTATPRQFLLVSLVVVILIMAWSLISYFQH